MKTPVGRTRTSRDPFAAADAVFKKAPAKPVEEAPAKPSIPGAKQLVSLRIDQDVLEHFQADGQGWQERINEALRRSIQK